MIYIVWHYIMLCANVQLNFCMKLIWTAIAMNWWPRPRTVQWCAWYFDFQLFIVTCFPHHMVYACVCVRGTLCLAVDLLRARNFPCSRYGELILENEIHIKHCCSVWFQLTRRFELFFSRSSQLFEHHTLHHYWYYFVWRKSVDM